MRPLVVAVLLFGGVGAPAADFHVPKDLEPAVARANTLGEQIWLHDEAAARATDVLAARGVLEEDTRIRGWLTDEFVSGEDVGVIVTFIGDDEGRSAGLYRVRIPPEGKPSFEALVPAVPLDDSQRARLLARQSAIVALEKVDLRCGESYNSVVLAAPDRRSILVYLLAATGKPDLLIAGGHYLFEFSADGARLKSQRAFTRSCIDIPLNDESKGKVEALTLTHLLDPTPTEVHSYLSRYASKTLYLGTTENSLLWIIKDGMILTASSYADEPPKKKR